MQTVLSWENHLDLIQKYKLKQIQAQRTDDTKIEVDADVLLSAEFKSLFYLRDTHIVIYNLQKDDLDKINTLAYLYKFSWCQQPNPTAQQIATQQESLRIEELVQECMHIPPMDDSALQENYMPPLFALDLEEQTNIQEIAFTMPIVTQPATLGTIPLPCVSPSVCLLPSPSLPLCPSLSPCIYLGTTMPPFPSNLCFKPLPIGYEDVNMTTIKKNEAFVAIGIFGVKYKIYCYEKLLSCFAGTQTQNIEQAVWMGPKYWFLQQPNIGVIDQIYKLFKSVKLHTSFLDALHLYYQNFFSCTPKTRIEFLDKLFVTYHPFFLDAPIIEFVPS